MRDARKYWIPKIVVGKLVGLAIMGFFVMLLWNNIVVTLFGLNMISYLQSLGLLVLTRILTGNFGPRGFGGPGAMMHRKGFMHERWKNMSEEEKNQWKERMK
jgi:hypothetical protein